MDPMLREKASQVRLLALDVDGILTDGSLYFTPEVRKRCHWVTSNRGGRGAVREICHLLLDSRGLAQKWLDRILAG